MARLPLIILLGFLGAGRAESDGRGRDQSWCGEPDASLLVVAEGSSGWRQKAVDSMATLGTALNPRTTIQVAWFDTETDAQAAVHPTESNGALVLRSRISMNDAIAVGLRQVDGARGMRAMVVIAHEGFYPTMISERYLIESAQRLEVMVHTIHLTETAEESSIIRRFGRALTAGVFWLLESAMEDGGQSYSAAETGRLLKRLAEATGGQACVAVDEQTIVGCTAAIAGEIMRHGRPKIVSFRRSDVVDLIQSAR